MANYMKYFINIMGDCEWLLVNMIITDSFKHYGALYGWLWTGRGLETFENKYGAIELATKDEYFWLMI